ncbi:MAG: 5-deoxy-glucuronate isomerase [Bacteroidota bacterium]
MPSPHLIKPKTDQSTLIDVSPQSTGWDYLSFKVIKLQAGDSYSDESGNTEVALVPLQGSALLAASDQVWQTSRSGVFTQMPDVLYVPPGQTISVQANTDFEFAMGSAPAEGKYPTRLFRPEEQKVEVRGHAPALREVHHTLAWPLPAERLILFEVYVPGGNWSGWPPHCHDGYGDSPYLEEIYYYRLQPENGVAFHRNYRLDNGFDEILPAKSGDCVIVEDGFHPVGATPGTNIYFLNYLAGDALDEARDYKPFEDPNTTWIKEDWEANKLHLPIQFDS